MDVKKSADVNCLKTSFTGYAVHRNTAAFIISSTSGGNAHSTVMWRLLCVFRLPVHSHLLGLRAHRRLDNPQYCRLEALRQSLQQEHALGVEEERAHSLPQPFPRFPSSSRDCRDSTTSISSSVLSQAGKQYQHKSTPTDGQSSSFPALYALPAGCQIKIESWGMDTRWESQLFWPFADSIT